jgi:hypothetical protein
MQSLTTISHSQSAEDASCFPVAVLLKYREISPNPVEVVIASKNLVTSTIQR